MYGNVALNQDLTIENTGTLSIAAFGTLTIPVGVTLTNNGKIVVYPGGVINGSVTGNTPVGSDLTISGGISYTYAGGLLTITGDGTYTITMGNGETNTTTDRIAVAPGVIAAITLSAVSIDMSGNANTAAFDMSGATVSLTLTGTNVLKSGSTKAGLQAPEGSNLTINAADVTHTLSATGGSNGAGIGGGSGNGGSIAINGGAVSATGGFDSAGIGGGGVSSIGGSVAINGGTVTTTGGTWGPGIGGGLVGSPGTITALSGNAVVFASSIQPTLTVGGNATQAIVFKRATGTMYGSVTLQQDLTIPEGYTLDLAGNTLTIGSYTLTNEGTINKNGGTIVGTVGGGGNVN
jgi:hypothetical protein